MVSILPGCAYPEGDVTLFEALSAVVKASELSTNDAWKLTDCIQQARLEATEPALIALLADCLPLLEPYRLILEANPVRLRQALSMLEAMFRARASTRHASAVYRTATAVATSFERDLAGEREVPQPFLLGAQAGLKRRS